MISKLRSNMWEVFIVVRQNPPALKAYVIVSLALASYFVILPTSWEGIICNLSLLTLINANKSVIYFWVIPWQLTQSSELFPVHFIDFLEKTHVKTSIWSLALRAKFHNFCDWLIVYSKTHQLLIFHSITLKFAQNIQEILGIICFPKKVHDMKWEALDELVWNDPFIRCFGCSNEGTDGPTTCDSVLVDPEQEAFPPHSP